MGQDPSTFSAQLTRVYDAFHRLLGDENVDYELLPPATEHEIEQVEASLGCRIPCPLRQLFAHLSARVTLEWYADQYLMDKLPIALQQVQSGSVFLSLEHQEAFRVNWEDDWDERYRAGQVRFDLHDLYPFQQTENGDALAIVVAGEQLGNVVFQSFYNGELQCARLATNWATFFGTWGSLGFPGPEECAIAPFYDWPHACLSNTLPNSRDWQAVCGLRNVSQ